MNEYLLHGQDHFANLRFRHTITIDLTTDIILGQRARW